jgi:hypothetical protein
MLILVRKKITFNFYTYSIQIYLKIYKLSNISSLNYFFIIYKK